MLIFSFLYLSISFVENLNMSFSSMHPTKKVLLETVITLLDSKKPEEILIQMTLGLDIQEPSAVIQDRAEAIHAAVDEAQEGDVVLVLGKGHEKGQEIGNTMHPFDDRVELAKAIEDKK